jgi:hypothetical protein
MCVIYMYYPGRYYGSYYPLLDNRLSGVLSEYAQFNDVAIRNNAIYGQSLASNYIRPYSSPYYSSPSLYANPYLYGASPYYGYSNRYPYYY